MQVVGAAGAGAALAGTAGASTDVSTEVLDSQFDRNGIQEALVVFDDAESAMRLETLDLQEPYHVFEHLDIAWTFLDVDHLETVAGWDSVRRVKRAEELEWHNDDTSRRSMAVDTVHQELGYDGEDAPVNEDTSYTYFAEVPEGVETTGAYSVGPAQVTSENVDDVENEDGWVDVEGTSDDDVVVGADQNP